MSRRLLAVSVVSALLISSCWGGSEEPAATTTATNPPATTLAAAVTTTTGAVAPTPPDEPVPVDLPPPLRLQWEPLDGPPGGNTTFVAQDRHHPSYLYAGTLRGLYRSRDRGDTWTLIPDTAQVADVAFTRSLVVACVEGRVYDVSVETDTVTPLEGTRCGRLGATDDTLYAASSAEGNPDAGITISRRSDGQSEWTDVTPPPGLWRDLVERAKNPERPGFIGVERLAASGDDVLAVVALAPGPSSLVRDETRLLASHDRGATWTEAEVGFAEPVEVWDVPWTDTDTGLLVATGREPTADPPFHPIADLLRVSDDAGRSWRSPTGIRDISSPSIGDVDVVGDRMVLTDVDFSTVELSRRDGRLLARKASPVVDGYSFAFPLSDQLFDIADASTIFARGRLGWEGIIRSRDAGATWQRLTGGMSAAPAANLTVHPTDPDVFVASGNLGYLPHITRDGGTTWEPMVGSANMADEVAFDPHDPDHLLMMTELGQLLESRDGGETWVQAAPEFIGARVQALALSPDRDTLYVSNLGVNVANIDGLRPDDDKPIGQGEMFWQNHLGSPDYAYDLAVAPDGTVFATYSPKKFETHGSVWRLDASTGDEAGGWVEVLRVDGSTGFTDIAIGPGEPYRVYAAATGPDAAVWMSSDAGATWTALDGHGFSFVTVHEISADPSDPMTVYAAPWGAGLFRSRDGGSNWTEMDIPTVSAAVVAVNPRNPRHIVLGDRTRPVVWESGDGGVTWEASIQFDPDVYFRVSALTFYRDALYMSLMGRSGAGPAVFGDVPETGATFVADGEGLRPMPGMSRAALAFSGSADALYAVGHIGGVYEMNGDEWIDISEGLPDMGFFDVCATAGVVLVAGGSDLDRSLTPRIGDPAAVNNVYRWSGAGVWEPLVDGNLFGAPVKQLEADPSDPAVLFAATGNGLWVSPDLGANWRRESEGLASTDVGAIAVAPGRIYAGTLGSGTAVGVIAAGHRVTWQPGAGPARRIVNVRILPHPEDPTRLWASAYPGGVFRTADGGATWMESNFAVPSFEVRDPTVQGYYALAADPRDANTLYLGIFGRGLYRSTDGAATWMPAGSYGELAGAAITDVAVDPSDSRRVWLATTDRGILVSTDAGATWSEAGEGMQTREVLRLVVAGDGTIYAGTAGYGVYMRPAGSKTWTQMGRSIGIGEWRAWDRRLYFYGSLLFDPDIPDTVYLGQFPSGFFVSDDGGGSWRSSILGMGNDGIFSLVVHPENRDLLFAGTYNGVLRSDDRGATWRDTSAGMPPEQWPFTVLIDDERPQVMYTATKNGHNKGFCERNRDSFCGVVMKSTDGGATWRDIGTGLDRFAEYYMIVPDPRDHDVLYMSSSRGIYVTVDGGEHWHSANDGLEDVTEFFVRDNVAQNLKLTPDGRYLLFAVVGYGVWRAELPPLP